MEPALRGLALGQLTASAHGGGVVVIPDKNKNTSYFVSFTVNLHVLADGTIS